MADRSALEAAAAAGVINAEQVGPLYDFLSSQQAGVKPALAGEEDLRFIRNFHDVFLAIGIVLFAVGLAIAIGTWVAGSAHEPRQAALLAGGLSATAAVVMWLLGEVFARRRRLFLPAIAIVVSMTAFAVVGAASLYFGLLIGENVNLDADLSQGMPPQVRAGLMLAAAFAFITPLMFYARFRLPFSMGLAGGGVAAFIIATALMFSFDETLKLLPAIYLGLGVLLFFAGVAFDARDPMRTTRYSDNGFWLHFAAAPLILNGAFGLVTMAFGGGQVSGAAGLVMASADENANALGQAAATLAVIIALGLISLLINRRVLIVSALLTTGVAIGVIMNEFGLGAGALAASTLIVLGGFVLILGAGWHGVRRALLGWVKPDGAWARIFPPEAPAAA